MPKGIAGRRQAPKPITSMSQRLEDVRSHFGVPSLRAFHAELREGWEQPVSYEAVRNYHYDREAPASYLARVAAVFSGVRLAYLISGEGPMLEEEEQALAAEHTHVASALEAFVTEDFFAGMTEELGDSFQRIVLGTRRVDLARVWRRLSGRPRTDVELGREVARTIRAPLEKEGGLDLPLSWIDEDTLDDYVSAACAALLHLAGPLHAKEE